MDTGGISIPISMRQMNGGLFNHSVHLSSWITLVPFQVLLLFPNASDMRLVYSCGAPPLPEPAVYRSPYLQTQMLRSLLGGFGTLHHHGLQRGFEQLEVSYVLAPTITTESGPP